MAFAQGRLDGTGIARFQAPARKADLAAVMAQAIGAPGQQYLRAVRARHQAGQHGRLHQRPGWQQVGKFIVVPACPVRHACQRMQHPQQNGTFTQRRRESGALSLAIRQDHFHQVQALIIVHLRPAGDFIGIAQAALA